MRFLHWTWNDSQALPTSFVSHSLKTHPHHPRDSASLPIAAMPSKSVLAAKQRQSRGAYAQALHELPNSSISIRRGAPAFHILCTSSHFHNKKTTCQAVRTKRRPPLFPPHGEQIIKTPFYITLTIVLRCHGIA